MSVAAARFLPSTLFGRLLASVLLAIGVTLGVMMTLIVQDRRELSMRVGNLGDSSRRIAEITRSLEQLAQQARTRERARLTEDTSLRIEPDVIQREPLSRHQLFRVERAFASQLSERLGEGYGFKLERPIHRDHPGIIRLVPRRHREDMQVLDLTVRLRDGDALLFRVASPQLDPPLPWNLFIQLGVLTLVLVGVLFVVTRNVTRPLSDLARAADAAGRSVRNPPLAEQGVREIREATRAFNTMQDRVLRYLDSRTGVLAAMSHDLRTPLTRLRLRVESVHDAQLRERFGADLDEMEGMVRGALALFEGLDDDEAFESVDVNALLAKLVADYGVLGSDVSVTGTALDFVHAKPRALRRCLTNLVDNALKFGKRATILVEDGPELIVRVCDEGPGIPEESLERVFEPFHRLEHSRSRDTGGAGLGLSIARDVVQTHGGTLTLRNRPEGGLMAEMRLPRR
jgi:signal transduction histidine kinase